MTMPEMPAMPRTTREALTALWYTVQNGLSAKVDEITEVSKATSCQVQEILQKLPVLITQEDHEKCHREFVESLAETKKVEAEHGERRKISKRDWLMVVLVALGTLTTIYFSWRSMIGGAP
jgi:hypothetical protein